MQTITLQIRVGFSNHRMGSEHRLEGIMNLSAYMDKLWSFMTTYAVGFLPLFLVFQDSRILKHKSQIGVKLKNNGLRFAR